MSKKSKKIDQQIDSINQINLTNKIIMVPKNWTAKIAK